MENLNSSYMSKSYVWLIKLGMVVFNQIVIVTVGVLAK
jgi:hypothetical protein